MPMSIFYVRPIDDGKGWAIDEYDGRGAWQHSVLKTPEGAVMDKQTAQRAVFQLRRKTVNSAPVNSGMFLLDCIEQRPPWWQLRRAGRSPAT